MRNVITLTTRGNIPAGTTGRTDDRTDSSDKPWVWVFWDDKTKYPRWFPQDQLATWHDETTQSYQRLFTIALDERDGSLVALYDNETVPIASVPAPEGADPADRGFVYEATEWNDRLRELMPLATDALDARYTRNG